MDVLTQGSGGGVVIGELQDEGLREVGGDATFSISSAKPGNGVEQLRDNNLETFWQSDGQAPHMINIHFPRKTAVSLLCFYVDYSVDESYTPKKVAVRAGHTQHDLIDMTASIDLHEVSGWVQIAIEDATNPGKPLRTHLLQLKLLGMQQNGRDAHVRGIKVFGPRLNKDPYRTVEMQQFGSIR
jgi:anaphase-promoting complex subunit 10